MENQKKITNQPWFAFKVDKVLDELKTSKNGLDRKSVV